MKVIMMKEKRKPLEGLKKVGGALKDILLASTSHPTTAALAIMALTVAIRPITERSEAGRKFGSDHLDGMFAVARDLGVAGAVAPVAIGAFAAIQSALEARKKPT